MTDRARGAGGEERVGGRRRSPGHPVPRWRVGASLALAGYEGRYGGPMYGDATVSLEDGGLVLRVLPNPDLVADLEQALEAMAGVLS